MPIPCWLKHLCSIRALVPVSFFLFFFLSLSQAIYFFGAQRPSEFTFLPGLLRPSQEGTVCLHPIERVPEASVNRTHPVPGALLAFCIKQGISASFSPLLSYHRLWTTRFWPLKDLNIHPNPCPLNRWCHPTISSSVFPFSSCLQSFPASGSFQMSQLFPSGGQSIGFSDST